MKQFNYADPKVWGQVRAKIKDANEVDNSMIKIFIGKLENAQKQGSAKKVKIKSKS